MEVAAAGGHHVFLLGEPGSGKTMLASRLPTILPDLDPDTALVTTSLHSVAGLVPAGLQLLTRPPLQAPHHSVTMPALIGGGSRSLAPGAASLAHGGVLFLDEATEFAPSVLDSLREPLESGRIHLHRSGVHATYPAAFQLVMASNPCPCGGGRGGRGCSCSSLNRRRYLSRLSGPLLDRMDIRIDMHAPSRADMATGATRLRSPRARTPPTARHPVGGQCAASRRVDPQVFGHRIRPGRADRSSRRGWPCLDARRRSNAAPGLDASRPGGHEERDLGPHCCR